MTDDDDFENFDDERGTLPQCRFCDNFEEFCHERSVQTADGWCSDWKQDEPPGPESLARVLGDLQDTVNRICTMLVVAGITTP